MSIEAIPVPVQNVTWYAKNTTMPSIRIAAYFSWLLAGSVKEKGIYEKILSDPAQVVEGTVKELAVGSTYFRILSLTVLPSPPLWFSGAPLVGI